jgi:glycosyltransferase involved in cell wall biosynthesis
MNLPKVTIIIPVYNVEEFIIACLQSVLDQNYNNIEVVIVDDCSPDNSIKVAKNLIIEIKKKFSFKIIQHEINMGLSAARNTGLYNASGDYIFFLDSDDTLLTDSISILVSQIKNDDIDIVIGNFISYNNFPYYNDSFLLVYPKTIQSFLTESIYPMACNKLIKLNTLKIHSLLFVNNIYHEDMLFSFFLSLYAKKILVLNRITYNYRRRAGSIMSNFNEKHINDLLFVLNEEIRIFTNDQFLQLFNSYIINQCYYILKIIFRCSPVNISYIKYLKNTINTLKYSHVSLKKLLIFSPVPLIRFFFFLKNPFK